MDRATQITNHLKAYDRELYCARDREGKLCVFRNSTRWETFDMGDAWIRVARSTPFLIFPLTKNFRPREVPVDWGIEPILAHLRLGDTRSRDLVLEQEKQYDEKKASNERDLKNKNEAFAYEFRDHVKSTFNDYNVSTLEKKDRRKQDEVKNGNSK